IGRDEATGKLLYRNVLARTQAECKAKLREAMRNVQQTGSKPQPVKQSKKEPDQPVCRFTTGEWLRTWFELYSKPNLRETTQEQYTNFLEKHLIPNIGDIPLEKLTSLRLQKLYQDLRTSGRVIQNRAECSGLSPKTVRSIHMVLHSALEQAVKEGLIRKNPTDGCNPPKLERKEMKVIQSEQIGAYLQAAANHNVLPMFYLELTSGLRRGELLALLWTDLNLEKNSISVCKSVRGSQGELKVSAPKTRHSIRTVVIPQQAVDLLIQEHELHPDNPYMFPSPVTGTMYHPDTAGRIHRKLLKEAGIEPVRFHDLRHTFATLALQNGVDIKTLSGMLGHYSSGFTLDTYTHVTDKMQQEAAEKVGNFMEMAL
ncbi:MAG: site-specific integrase, partial [Oscillospiraceae bacterium]|nr:site-specific integrase [Oscillospiraceae bacterium]